MKNKLFLFILSLFLLSCAATRISQQQLQSTLTRTDTTSTAEVNVNHLLNSSVALINVNQDGTISTYCSGFFISPSKIVSVAHCFSSRDELFPGSNIVIERNGSIGTRISFMTYSEWTLFHQLGTLNFISDRARITILDNQNDLAVLEIVNPRAFTFTNFLSLSRNNNIRVGQRCYVVSHPVNNNFIFTDGIISRVLRNEQLIPTQIIATPNVFFGSSGSAATDTNGNVIGITRGIMNRQSYLGIFTPVNQLIRLLGN